MDLGSRKNRKTALQRRTMGLLNAILLIMLLAASAVGISSCGDDETRDTSSTGTTAKTNTSTATTGTGMDTTAEVPPSPEPAPSPSPTPAPAVPLTIVFYAVDPDPVHAGTPLTCMVSVEGTAAAVTMGLTGPYGSTSQTVHLVEGTTVGGVTNWTATVTAPATPGGWRFGATAIAMDGTEVIPDAGGLSASLLPFEVIP